MHTCSLYQRYTHSQEDTISVNQQKKKAEAKMDIGIWYPTIAQNMRGSSHRHCLAGRGAPQDRGQVLNLFFLVLLSGCYLFFLPEYLLSTSPQPRSGSANTGNKRVEKRKRREKKKNMVGRWLSGNSGHRRQTRH
ncbi:hypothetical protein MAPG_07848 [Magnaporthiopsis poae ATCC 64411]|uniref:Uncharacterized protein n=1 Tax=Magnaporthiopsis poae (strain ATCC 64411 / 73-15) TaxID=644358 RepID=A0A0C4E5S4_MAGP6|nr:hypothetical protein MAPG_07848 [Magnaporthiopsis poae ATCC 64411]